MTVAIVGTGPAGLMAAFHLARAGVQVQVFEKRASAGRKLLIAGSSGLNVSFKSTPGELIKNYLGRSQNASAKNDRLERERWEQILSTYSQADWLQFIEQLGLETFLGTSGRYFVREMKASGLLRAWIDALKKMGVEFFYRHECVGFESTQQGVTLQFYKESSVVVREFAAVCFALGGGSWEPSEKPLRWPTFFSARGLKLQPFESANSGFRVQWKPEFLKEAEGQPLKGVVLTTAKGSRAGELMITSYGLEGTPVYALGQTGSVWLDLKPTLSEKQILEKMLAIRENLSPLRRVKKGLNFSPAILALIFHETPPEVLKDLNVLVSQIKHFPLQFGERQPLDEAISSTGGLSWLELDSQMMLKNHPGVFAAGEMLDWDAPTGGFLIQGSVSQGVVAARGMLEYLKNSLK